MKIRFIDRFQAIILDMGNTFMFDCDRFGPKEDFHGAYRKLGGRLLSSKALRLHIELLRSRMLADYRNPEYYDDYRTVR